MTINDIKMIVEIARVEGVSLAANNHGISQSSLSRTLKGVEEKLGVRLFNRLGRSLVLTEEGKIYQTHFLNILNELELAKGNISQLHDRYKETVKISLHPNYAKTLLPQLELLLSEVSSLDVEYILQGTNKGYEDLLSGQVDIAIVADIKSFPDIVKVNLWKEYIGLFSRDGKSKDHIVYNPDMPLAPRVLKLMEFKKTQQIADYNIICSILPMSEKMGILPAAFASTQKKMKLVKKFPEVSISMIYHRGRAKTKAFKKCLSLVKGISKEVNF